MNKPNHEYQMLSLPHTLKVREMVSAYHVFREPGYKFEGEYHNFWEIVCVLDGSAGVAADGQICPLEKGQIIFHRPMEFHRIWTEGNKAVELAIMSFTADGMEYFEKKIMKLSSGKMEEMGQLIEQIPLAFSFDGSGITGLSDHPLEQQIFCNALELFFLKIMRDSNVSRRQDHSPSAKNYNRIVRVLNEYVEKNLSLNELSHLCDMSVSNLKKTFHKYTGIGIMKYFTGLKMKHAIRLLEQGLTIAEVSRALSYADQNYFSVVFKREIGYPPSVYRKMQHL